MKYFAKGLYDSERFLDNQIIEVDDSKVSAIYTGNSVDADITLNGLVSAGFVDVQVNGGGGKLLNNEPNVQTIQKMTSAHQRFGTTSLLPTLITDNITTMLKASDAIAQAISEQCPSVLGVHFEGPHLSVAKKGIHPSDKIRSVTDQELELVTRKDLGQVVLTVAPENVSCDVIKDLIKNNVIVCLGHSNADFDTVQAALEAGATGFTHLYNAMSGLTGRQAGMVGAALLSEQSYAGLIVDLHHVCKQSAQIAINTKGKERVMLVTDSMSHIGTNQIDLSFSGYDIIKTDDKLTLQDCTLAGSYLDMSLAVRNTVHRLDYPLQDALDMASSTPSQFLGMQQSKGRLKEGLDADFVCLDNELNVTHTVCMGKLVFDSSLQSQIEELK